MNPKVSNPNDHKIVTFHNSTDFGFTPEMGCMYDGNAINGKTDAPGIDAGESFMLPYHVGHRLATNLAKYVMIRGATNEKPQLDAHGQPIVKAIWDTVKLDSMKSSYLTELYSESKPLQQTETERLMAKVEELRKFVAENVPAKSLEVAAPVQLPETIPSIPGGYADKAEVIAELTKRGIKFDARQNKANLEKLLTPVAA